MIMSSEVTMTKAQFDKLAEAASEDNCLARRDSEHGPEYGILLNGHLMAMATPDEDGEYRYISYM